jgi:8-oxo-dGTP pyrophosphatase MutT (NUDIX family)
MTPDDRDGPDSRRSLARPTPPRTMNAAALREHLRRRFAGTTPDPTGPVALAGVSPAEAERYRHLLPATPAPAAVLIPIVDHGSVLTVLLTERSQGLRQHAGQIAFPGGRVEPGDAGPVGAALRESEEEIGLLPEHVEVIGFLGDHVVMTGYRITPVVGLVRAGLALALDPTEVAAVFEVPLEFVLDPANHRLRRRPLGGGIVDVCEMPYGEHQIWGATAGMLASLARWVAGAQDAEGRG